MVRKERPDLVPMMLQALNGDIFGNYLMTEIGHGLDAYRMETTATKVEDGFILNTPNAAAAKFMPPTTPYTTRPKFAVVLARLIVGGEDRGIPSMGRARGFPRRSFLRVVKAPL